ncbi:hypothetical protein ACFVUH_14070 [Kitasatospora sp. NPDC058032]|uniref:hypothetical protein n=1 Tax=unclassified Kitasatospora TaxID=2633591 RepID=UPI0033ADBBDA
MRSSARTKFTRFLAVPAVAAAGVVLATAPAYARSISIAADGATVADSGRTLNVSVTYQCLPEFQSAAITVQGTQSGVSGRGSIHVPCVGVPGKVTVPVTTASADQAWSRSSVDLSLYIADLELNRVTTTARVVAN